MFSLKDVIMIVGVAVTCIGTYFGATGRIASVETKVGTVDVVELRSQVSVIQGFNIPLMQRDVADTYNLVEQIATEMGIKVPKRTR
jgi:hypothetical protein